MSALWAVLAAVALALGAVAGAVFGLGDRSVFISPPEAVVEGFVRQLETERYEQARPFLADELASHVSADSLRALTRALEERVGKIQDVTGEREWVSGERASAAAALRTERVEKLELTFPLVRSQGEWKIAELRALEGG